MTDGFLNSHDPYEEFGGGTLPLYAEVHLTAWANTQPSYADMQFIKFEVINKGTQSWAKTYFSIIFDPDIGTVYDDFMGCDTVRNLGFVYNSTNNDPIYGTSPPAAGCLLLKGSYIKYSNPPKQLTMTSLNTFYGMSTGVPPCETEPNPGPLGAYRMMQGLKKDSTCWLDPTQLVYPPNFYKKTKFLWPGDPETNEGWTGIKGMIHGCNNDSSGTPSIPGIPFDCRIVLGSGSENLTVMPGDTQTIVMSQLIAKGTSRLNSVTKLKQLADVAKQFYESGFTIGINKISNEVPTSYSLYQNYPNPFNPVTKIKFQIPSDVKRKTLQRDGGQASDVKLIIYNILGKEIQTLVNEKLNPGIYEVTFDGSKLPSGVFFYQLRVGDFVDTKKLILLK
jgi:hypothetical protein